MVIGIGTDIIENVRIAKALDRTEERFLNKVFTKDEIVYCTRNNKVKVLSLAARFAGKEAVAKALGTGIGSVSWKEIEILGDENGSPEVNLLGKAKEKVQSLGASEVKISLSHTKEHSIAFAILI